MFVNVSPHTRMHIFNGNSPARVTQQNKHFNPRYAWEHVKYLEYLDTHLEVHIYILKNGTRDFVTQNSVMVTFCCRACWSSVISLENIVLCTHRSSDTMTGVEPSVLSRKVRRRVDETPALKRLPRARQVGGNVKT